MRETLISYSTYLCINSLILVCTGDQTQNFCVSGRPTNQLSSWPGLKSHFLGVPERFYFRGILKIIRICCFPRKDTEMLNVQTTQCSQRKLTTSFPHKQHPHVLLRSIPLYFLSLLLCVCTRK